MDINGKIWGHTSSLFSKNNVEICRIVGKKGGHSSTHKHKSKWSMFFVEKGSIKVTVEKSYNLNDQTILYSGESTTISPEEFHKFEVLEEDTVCYEVYWTEIDKNDIIRKDSGSLQS